MTLITLHKGHRLHVCLLHFSPPHEWWGEKKLLVVVQRASQTSLIYFLTRLKALAIPRIPAPGHACAPPSAYDLSRVVRGDEQRTTGARAMKTRLQAALRVGQTRRLFTARFACFLPSTHPPPPPPPLASLSLNKFARFSSRVARTVLSLVTPRRRHRKPPLFSRCRERCREIVVARSFILDPESFLSRSYLEVYFKRTFYFFSFLLSSLAGIEFIKKTHFSKYRI